MKKLANLVLLLLTPLFLMSCDKTVFYPEPAKTVEPIVVVPVSVPVKVKNKYQLKVDSMLKVGLLTVGIPTNINRVDGDDETYDPNAGYDKRGNTTGDYVKAFSWRMMETYSDKAGYSLWTLRHNNHILTVTNPSAERFKDPNYQVGKFMSGEELYNYLVKHRDPGW